MSNNSPRKVNQHLEHIEDSPFNDGIQGTRDAIHFLQSLRDMLGGNGKTKSNPVTVTSKWDGAPAIIAGINPENGKFFVGTKGVFSATPKLNYTPADIERNHPSPGLQAKLKYALEYLPELGFRPNRILQGDMMYTAEDLKFQTIDGERFITFQPNTIVYAIPEASALAKTIRHSKMGIVWHTEYTGKTIATLQARFAPNIAGLKMTKNVWFRDATFIDATGAATLSPQDNDQLNALLSEAGSIFTTLAPNFINKLATNENLSIDLKTFNNSKVRQGQAITNVDGHITEFIRWLTDKYNKRVIEAKQPETKRNRELVKKEVVGFFSNNRGQLKAALKLHNLLADAKLIIVRKLSQVREIGTFVRTEDGYKVVAPEGFVAINGGGNAIKLVDRLEFSHNNFTVAKNWEK